MKILVKAKPGAKRERLERTEVAEDSTLRGLPAYLVAVTAAAVDGKANDNIVRLIADRFGIPLSSVRIVSGHATSLKIIEIPEEGRVRL